LMLAYLVLAIEIEDSKPLVEEVFAGRRAQKAGEKQETLQAEEDGGAEAGAEDTKVAVLSGMFKPGKMLDKVLSGEKPGRKDALVGLYEAGMIELSAGEILPASMLSMSEPRFTALIGWLKTAEVKLNAQTAQLKTEAEVKAYADSLKAAAGAEEPVSPAAEEAKDERAEAGVVIADAGQKNLGKVLVARRVRMIEAIAVWLGLSVIRYCRARSRSCGMCLARY